MKKIFILTLLCAAMTFAGCRKDKDETIPVTKVTISQSSFSVVEAGTEVLTATVLPKNATDKTVTWSSSDKSVATVDNTGVVYAVKPGKATITVTSVSDNTKAASCAVTVIQDNIHVTSVKLNKTETSIQIKKTEKLTATVLPANATYPNLTWESSDETVAKVDDGLVTALKVGKATITVYATFYKEIKDVCTVTVTKVPDVEWAFGNLVADGAGGAKIGSPADGGLFFQFGSLVGWSASGAPAIAVKPAAFNGKEGWTETGKIWQGTTGVVPFAAAGSDDEKAGVGDPCSYYLKSSWRLPTIDELEVIFAGGYGNGWSWDEATSSATHPALSFLAAGRRDRADGSLEDIKKYGFYWSASPYSATNGISLYFSSAMLKLDNNDNRAYGFPVRCVRNININ